MYYQQSSIITASIRHSSLGAILRTATTCGYAKWVHMLVAHNWHVHGNHVHCQLPSQTVLAVEQFMAQQ